MSEGKVIKSLTIELDDELLILAAREYVAKRVKTTSYTSELEIAAHWDTVMASEHRVMRLQVTERQPPPRPPKMEPVPAPKAAA